MNMSGDDIRNDDLRLIYNDMQNVITPLAGTPAKSVEHIVDQMAVMIQVLALHIDRLESQQEVKE